MALNAYLMLHPYKHVFIYLNRHFPPEYSSIIQKTGSDFKVLVFKDKCPMVLNSLLRNYLRDLESDISLKTESFLFKDLFDRVQARGGPFPLENLPTIPEEFFAPNIKLLDKKYD